MFEPRRECERGSEGLGRLIHEEPRAGSCNLDEYAVRHPEVDRLEVRSVLWGGRSKSDLGEPRPPRLLLASICADECEVMRGAWADQRRAFDRLGERQRS